MNTPDIVIDSYLFAKLTTTICIWRRSLP